MTAWSIVLPDSAQLAAPTLNGGVHAISHDGSMIAFVATSGREDGLYLRRLNSFGAQYLEGTRGARSPFFSPNDEWIAFWSDGEIRKIPVRGGVVQRVAPAPLSVAGVWLKGDRIVFSDYLTLLSVRAQGGIPDTISFHRGLYSPSPLPGDTTLLVSREEPVGEIGIVSLRTGEFRTLGIDGGTPRYTANGYLVFARDASLFAQPFHGRPYSGDVEPILITEEVHTGLFMLAQFSVSDAGRMAFIPGTSPTDLEFVWVDEDGTVEPLDLGAAAYEEFALSPDGARLAMTVRGPQTHIKIVDLGRPSVTQITFPGQRPVWSPDGRWVAFLEGDAVYRIRTEGESMPVFIREANNPIEAWGPDDRLAIRHITATDMVDIGIIDLERPDAIEWVQATSANEWGVDFSPDGEWMTYMVNAPNIGRRIYVRRIDGSSDAIQISGKVPGMEPLWAPDGSRIVYRDDLNFYAVDVTTQPSLRFSEPYVVVNGNYEDVPGRSFDIAQDGRLLTLRRRRWPASKEIRIIDNWFEMIAQTVNRVTAR